MGVGRKFPKGGKLVTTPTKGGKTLIFWRHAWPKKEHFDCFNGQNKKISQARREQLPPLPPSADAHATVISSLCVCVCHPVTGRTTGSLPWRWHLYIVYERMLYVLLSHSEIFCLSASDEVISRHRKWHQRRKWHRHIKWKWCRKWNRHGKWHKIWKWLRHRN